MKRINMGLQYYVLLIAVVLFLIVSLSSCKMTGNIVLNGKDLIIKKMKGIHVLTGVNLKSDKRKVDEVKVDTSVNNEATGDFRYDNMFK